MSGATAEKTTAGVRVRGFERDTDEVVSEVGDRLAWEVTPDAPVEVSAVFTDDPGEADAAATEGALVVVTTESAVAATVTTADVPVVRWDYDDPPWSFLTARVEAAVERRTDELSIDGDSDTRVGHEPVPVPGESDGPEARLASYEQLMNSVGDAVYVLDDEGRFVYVNEAMTELTGYEREEIVGQPPGFIKPEDAVEDAEDALRGMLSSEGPSWASVELEIFCADDSRVPVEDHMTLLPYEDRLRGTVGVLRDVTDQRRREAMFDGLLTATHRMMATDDPVAIAGIAAETAAETLEQELTTVRFHADGELSPVASTESTRESLPPRPAYEPGEGGVGEAFERGETVERGNAATPEGLDTALYVPMGDRGTITVGCRDGSLAGQDRYFAELLAATTERALDRATREQSLRRYQALVEQIDDLAFAVDEDREFTLATDPFAEAVGYDSDQLVGSTVDEVDTGVVSDALDTMFQADGTGVVVREGQLRRYTGEEIPVRIHATPVSTTAFDGAVVSVDNISDLLSARQAAERTRDRFGGLFDALTDPVVELRLPSTGESTDAELVRVNDEFDALLEVGEVTGTTLSNLSVDSRVYDQLLTAARRATVGAEGERAEVTLQTGGQTRHFVVRDVPYEVNDQTHTFVVFTEVTALKRRETHTAVLTRVLRHNLRNEISVVRGFVDQLDRKLDGNDTAITRINEAAEHLANLSETAGVVQEILQSEEPKKRPVDLEGMIHQAVSDTLSGYDDVRTELDTAPAETIAATEYLEHALAELFDNAVSHNPSAEPTLRVSVERTPEVTTVSIGDDGPPIPEMEWAVVTDQREITQLQHGSGIGLWLVRWVIDDHGGDLRLRQNDEDGTEIVLELPHGDERPATPVDPS
ncbi:PAS domain S-box protein [Halobaculum sp. MBLA0143]|uniref:sensor histidine kinase n=1 Tax=Halobaculum sp. MBLA0143 TaxID=3079933 RepID=UPI0035259FC3